jgi:hypothetical protein
VHSVFQRIQSMRKLMAGKLAIALVCVVAVVSLPTAAHALGLSNIVTLLNTITSTLKNVIGGELSQIQTLGTNRNAFEQGQLWPVASLNRARAFINSTQVQFGNLMNQIHATTNNSATLPNAIRLETLFRGSQTANLNQVSASYSNVYAPVPNANNATQLQRNLMDMDDALASGSLKTSLISDQTTSGMLSLADSIEQQSASAAPGSGAMLATESQIASLQSQAYLAKVLAAELRQESAKLAHQNMLIKQSAANTHILQNEMQHLLAHP